MPQPPEPFADDSFEPFQPQHGPAADLPAGPPAPPLSPPPAGRPPGPRRGYAAVLMLMMLGAAFALGIGVIRVVDDADGSGAFLRSVRSADGGSVVLSSAAPEEPAAASRASRFSILDEISDVLDQDFVDPEKFESTDLRLAAINGILDELGDPHTVFIDAQHYRPEDIGGSFEGIGCTVSGADGPITIIDVFDGSPAEAGGIRSGDVILEVDGESALEWSVELAVQRIRGKAGTIVELRVRHSDGTEELLPIVRDRIVVPSVRSEPLRDRQGNAVADIGLIRFRSFNEKTRSNLLDLLEAAAAAGLDKLILDLRRNPGGLLSSTVEVTGEFVDHEVILRQIHRDGSEEIFRDTSGGLGIDLELAVLIDGNSASGAEVMAAALRDHGRAVLIGEVTTGKGTVSLPRRLSDGSVLYVSRARWLSPAGTVIEGVGVQPDINVVRPETGFEADIDVQLMTAVDYLRGEWQPPDADGGDQERPDAAAEAEEEAEAQQQQAAAE